VADAFENLDFTPEFLQNLVALSTSDGKKVVKALSFLDTNEKHQSLEVHQLKGELEGVWTAKASKGLRFTFLRGANGRKIMLTCSQHYGD
jgi:mRNA-degrading endonuclease YafQ of YafQ-DinJ toxin-antitoxin module